MRCALHANLRRQEPNSNLSARRKTVGPSLRASFLQRKGVDVTAEDAAVPETKDPRRTEHHAVRIWRLRSQALPRRRPLPRLL